MLAYFLIAVSNRLNLEMCERNCLAGFTNSINGFWTFCDIDVGDYVSFLYGARIRNLYRVVKKKAYKNAERLPPWPSVTFRSGRTYYFPFRLLLSEERTLDESLVRVEFSYVAENLLLRGGYRRTHFQADSITFYSVSQMGYPSDEKTEEDLTDAESFEPKIVFEKDRQNIPYKFAFHEFILQSVIRKRLEQMLHDVLEYFSTAIDADEFEILGEKALPEGFVDIFVKLRHPIAVSKYLLVEVKTQRASGKDTAQLRGYVDEFGEEAIGGVLIARDFTRAAYEDPRILPVRYNFENIHHSGEYSYEELVQNLRLEIVVL